MNFFLAMAFLFFVGSILGWGIELVFRRIVHHKWINPGFCIGPYVPIYGSGLMLMFVTSYVGSLVDTGKVWLNDVIILLIIAATMTVLEYITGRVMLKVMNIRLWDYSRRWGNIDGLICPLFSLIWAGAGALYYFAVHQQVISWLGWFEHNLAFSFVVGLFFGVFTIDVVYSAKLVSKVKKWAAENEIVVRYETFKESVHDRIEEKMEKQRFFFIIQNARNIKEELESYIEKVKK